jgi:hypothetical protein
LLDISPNRRGILVQVSAGVRQSREGVRFRAPTPLFCSRERKSHTLPHKSCLLRYLEGLRPKRLPELSKKPCEISLLMGRVIMGFMVRVVS